MKNKGFHPHFFKVAKTIIPSVVGALGIDCFLEIPSRCQVAKLLTGIPHAVILVVFRLHKVTAECGRRRVGGFGKARKHEVFLTTCGPQNHQKLVFGN